MSVTEAKQVEMLNLLKPLEFICQNSGQEAIGSRILWQEKGMKAMAYCM